MGNFSMGSQTFCFHFNSSEKVSSTNASLAMSTTGAKAHSNI